MAPGVSNDFNYHNELHSLVVASENWYWFERQIDSYTQTNQSFELGNNISKIKVVKFGTKSEQTALQHS